jgi:hypothetical protein
MVPRRALPWIALGAAIAGVVLGLRIYELLIGA